MFSNAPQNDSSRVFSSQKPEIAIRCNQLRCKSGQIRDNQFVGMILLTLLLTTLTFLGTAFTHPPQRSREEVERDAKTMTKQLLAEFGDRLKDNLKKTVAAIYIRYSTDKQDSFESQLRAMFSYTVEHGFSIPEENIFYDLGYSGAKDNRAGLTAVRKARVEGRFRIFMAFCSSRLARNLRTLLQVLDEEFVNQGTRCVVIDQRLDSNDRERWNLLLPLLGWLDQIQRTAQARASRAKNGD